MAGEWIAGKGREVYAEFYGSGWDDMGNDVLQGACPGEEKHTGKSAVTDCRIYLGYGPGGEKPGAYCLHQSCRGVLDDLNGRFRDRLFDKSGLGGDRVAGDEGVARKPVSRESWIPAYDEGRLRRLVAGVEEITEEYLMERSPVDVRNMGPGEFLERVFGPDDRVLVFTDFRSQGDFLWQCGTGGFRLADRRGVKAVRSKLPVDGGADGVWFLNQPVDGQWYANPRRKGAPYSRRSAESITGWRHLIIENDVAPEELWLRMLVMCGLEIKAIYSSGGRSWHALYAPPGCAGKADMDAAARKAKGILPIFGADPGALTPVRLTRLPGCTRKGKMQRLIYLNPDPAAVKIRDMARLRRVAAAPSAK